MTSTEPDDQQPRGKDDIPIINQVPAGYPKDFTDLDYPPSVADEYVRCPDTNDPQAFAARVVGDSMEPDYRQGDIVLFAPNTPAENGQDCFVRLNGRYNSATSIPPTFMRDLARHVEFALV